MVSDDLGEATIVYETPDEGTVERTVENEHLAYFQDHWIVKIDEADGRDRVRRIPVQRVHYVERSVEEFREEVGTLTNQLESMADDLRERLLGATGHREPAFDDDGPTTVDVHGGDDEGDSDGGDDTDR